jgi:signal peptidase I
MSKKRSSAASKTPPPPSKPAGDNHQARATRETVESIVVAIVLAFLFRAFIAEAFVIPTGSMAPSLMGRHKDITCAQCGYDYQAGASIEVNDRDGGQLQVLGDIDARGRAVVAATCPVCRYRTVLDLFDNANHRSFTGDRILVSKFTYEFSDPKRWDVIVFKYPFNAKQNYIKRLVGLPGEQILIRHGDIFVRDGEDESYKIARKPDHKLKAMLQIVDDTKYIPQVLIDMKWPSRWQAWAKDKQDVASLWKSDDGGHSFATEGDANRDIWLRYHHIVPSQNDWQDIEEGQTPPNLADRTGQLITDFYAYNAYTSVDPFSIDEKNYKPSVPPEAYDPMASFGSMRLGGFGTLGLHWVGDLSFDGTVDVQGDQGELLLLIGRGGAQHVCRIDVATGKATLTMQNGAVGYDADDGKTVRSRRAETNVRGSGSYRLQLANVDAELRMWIDDRRVEFDGPTTYPVPQDDRPTWSPEEPGDLAPVGIGTRGLAVNIERLRVWRDIYYVATDDNVNMHEYNVPYGDRRIFETLRNPELWSTSRMFASRKQLEYTVPPNNYLPLGDNSPQSSDARMWAEPLVADKLMIGKALLIYWPHAWNRPIPFLPNFRRMQLIR